jgi:hypothetical protein
MPSVRAARIRGIVPIIESSAIFPRRGRQSTFAFARRAGDAAIKIAGGASSLKSIQGSQRRSRDKRRASRELFAYSGIALTDGHPNG